LRAILVEAAGELCKTSGLRLVPASTFSIVRMRSFFFEKDEYAP